ncbi:hypothetical protein FIBSPDRAFT_733804, partial [Athelia psychrophila]
MDSGSHCPRCTCDRTDSGCEQTPASSATTDLLRSNRAPSSAEFAIIHASIGEIAEEIQLIDMESKRLRRVLADLDIRQRKIRFDSISQRSVLSARRRLPVELISEIFMHCLPLRHNPSPAGIPWLLGSICQLWREVALSTPALWSFLDINITARQDTKAYHRAVDAWFSRSGNSRISLKL